MTESQLRPCRESSCPLRSPISVSTPGTPSGSRLPRLKWLTFHPRASASSVRCGPMKPVPPSIRSVRPAFSSAISLPPASASAVPAPALRIVRLESFIASSSASARGGVAREPVLRLFVPVERVLALQYPVVLVRVVHEAARHALVLQYVEELHAVVERHALVELAVDHERRGREVG